MVLPSHKTLRDTLLYYNLALCLAECHYEEQNTREQMPGLFLAPKVVVLDTSAGYSLNQFSGDNISPLVGDRGDTMKTGRSFPAHFRVFLYDISFIPNKIKASPPKVISINSGKHKVPDQLTTISITEDSLKTIALKKLLCRQRSSSRGIPSVPASCFLKS